MRYYSIGITPKNPDKPPPTLCYNSQLANGQPNMSALQIIIDAPVTVYSLAENAASIEIWGIQQQDAINANAYSGCVIDVFGGMQQGLPLANIKQAGLLLHGVIQQAWYNWIGTASVLHFVVMSETGLLNSPANISFEWRKGQKISDAIYDCLAKAFPKMQATALLNNDFIAKKDDIGFYSNLQQLAWHVNTFTKQYFDFYIGIDFYVKGNNICFFDKPNNGEPKQIAVTDMIQQPAWISPFTVQLYLVMRGDLAISDIIKLPKVSSATSSAAYNQYAGKNNIMINGRFMINKIRHIGNFRSPNPLDWITVIDAFAIKEKNAAVTVGGLE